MRTAINPRFVEVTLFVAVLLVAAYLRLGQPGIVEYKRDEANLSQIALDIAHGETLPLLGIGSSVGIPNPPVNAYILAIPYIFSSNPQIATQFIGLMNVLAVGLTYLFARHYVDWKLALVVALLFAVNPWAVIFSRKIWAQNMLPLFVLLTVYTGVRGFIDGKRWAKWLHIPLLAITVQIHFAALVIVPVTLYLLWYGRKQISKAVLLSIVIGVLLVMPYVVGMIRAGWHQTERLVGVLESSGSESRQLAVTTDALTGAGLLLAGTDIHSLAGPQEFENYLRSIPDAYPLFRLITLAVCLSAVWLLYQSLRHRDERTPIDLLLLIWLGVPIAIFSASWTLFFIHYLIPVFPAAFLITGFAFSDAWNLLNKRSQLRDTIFGLAGVLFAVIVVLQIWLFLALLNFVDERNTPDGFGTPLHRLLDVRQAILAEQSQQVIARVGGQALVFDEGPAVWNTLLYDVPTVRFENDSTQVFPAEPAIYLSNECGAETLKFPLREETEGCYSVSTREMSDFVDSDYVRVTERENTRFANGVSLHSYRWNAGCLYLTWMIEQTTSEDYSFAIHFLNANSESVAQADALSWFGKYWRPGDLVVRQFCVPNEAADIRSASVGMYTYDGTNFYNVDVLDEQGNPAGQTVELVLPET